MAVPEHDLDGPSSEARCGDCGRVITAEDQLANDGRCPSCGGVGSEDFDVEDPDAPPQAPWHFKLLLVGTAGYLVYRLIWFIFWLTGHGWNG